MGRLIIVAGAGGAGKSFFLKAWENYDDKSVRIKKFVDENRAPREIEIKNGDSDLIFAECYNPNSKTGKEWYKKNYPNLKLSECKPLSYHKKNIKGANCSAYGYAYGNSYYEVDVESIDNALNADKNPIVIVRRCETIIKLLRRYNNPLVIYVQSVLSGSDLVDRLIKLGEAEADAKNRQSRNTDDFEDYMKNIQSLPRTVRVVLNDYDNEDYTRSAIVNQIIDIYEEEIENYKFIDKSVFFIQSYADTQESAEKRAAISTGLGNCNHKLVLVQANDRQDSAYRIDDNVFEMIDNSDYIICDVTNDRCSQCQEKNAEGNLWKINQGTSANVWLELGYAIKQIKARGLKLEDRLIMIREENHEVQIPVDLGGNSLYVNTYKGMNLSTKISSIFNEKLSLKI